MIIGIFSFALVVLIVAIIILMRVKHLSKKVNGLREELDCCRGRLSSLEFYNLSEHESRLDQLEEMLELKEYFEKGPLNG